MERSPPLQWSEWFPVRDYGVARIPESKGVYELRAARGSAISAIPRADGTDDEGLLYIGHADRGTLYNRVRALCEAIVEKRHSGHSVRTAYHDLDFRSRFPVEEIQFRFVEARLPRQLAADLLHDYLRTFKDKPPLNFRFTSDLEVL
jgi:hypothetical protein